MKPITISAPPEIILEATIWYANQAFKILKERDEDITDMYNVGIIPSWPHYYSGVLQATSFLIQKNNFKHKNILLILNNKSDQKDILFYKEIIGPILGKHRESSKTIQALSKKYLFLKKQESDEYIIESIKEQIPFIRIINNIELIDIISIWKNTTIRDLNKLLDDKSIKNNYSIFFVWKCHNTFPEQQAIIADKNLIINTLSKETPKPKQFKEDFPIWYFFIKYIKEQKYTANAIAYLNSASVWWDIEKTTWFACIVA